MSTLILAAIILGAQTIPDVTLDIDPCVDVKTEFVERVVAAELAGYGDARSPSTVHVECSAASVVVSVKSASGSKQRTLRLDLEAPEARPRMLGVAIVELLEASWQETERPKPPPPPVPKPVAPTVVDVVPVPEKPARFELGANGALRGFGSITTLGVGLSFAYRAPSHFGVRLDGDLTAGHTHTELGDVYVRAESLGLSATFGGRTGAFALESAVGVRLGLARLSGSPEANAVGHVVNEWWGGPFVGVGVTYNVSRSVAWLGGVEGGWVTREAAGLVANDPRVVFEKVWWAARSGIGISW